MHRSKTVDHKVSGNIFFGLRISYVAFSFLFSLLASSELSKANAVLVGQDGREIVPIPFLPLVLHPADGQEMLVDAVSDLG